MNLLGGWWIWNHNSILSANNHVSSKSCIGCNRDYSHRHRFKQRYRTTFQSGQGLGCVIEQLDFQAKETAVEFLRHLLLHNWQLGDVKSEAEPLLLGLAT